MAKLNMPTLIRIWFREILGLFLILVGLYAWMMALNFFDHIMIIEGIGAFFIGLLPFKGGIHLMKVGLAAHILLAETKTGDKLTKSRKEDHS